LATTFVLALRRVRRERARVVLRFPPEEVADELDEEGISVGGLRGSTEQVRRDVEPGGRERVGEGALHVVHGGGVQVDLVGTTQNRRHALP